MNVKNDLKALTEEGIITAETAVAISDWYKKRADKNPNRILVLFGILGALLVGLGITLLIAHNWDQFPRAIKTFIGLLPLLIGQGLCAYVLYKKSESPAWRETTAVLLFFGVGTSIAIISQVYNLPEDMGGYLLTWMLLCLPLVYIMRSQAVSLMYLIGIVSYAIAEYEEYMAWSDLIYPALVLLVLPNYLLLLRNTPQSNSTTLHHYFFAATLFAEVLLVSKGFTEVLTLTLLLVFGLFYAIGKTPAFREEPMLKNPWHLLAIIGTLSMLYTASFKDFWYPMPDLHSMGSDAWGDIHPLIPIALVIFTAFGYLIHRGHILWRKPMQYVWIIYVGLFALGYVLPQTYILINLLIVAVAVITIVQAAREDNLLRMNYGTLTILLLITFRFFDSDLDFLLRGIIFVLCGLGFFLLNYYMIKKRQNGEQA